MVRLDGADNAPEVANSGLESPGAPSQAVGSSSGMEAAGSRRAGGEERMALSEQRETLEKERRHGGLDSRVREGGRLRREAGGRGSEGTDDEARRGR